jgi:sulfur carrier protein
MIIQVNGKKRELRPDTTLSALLAENGLRPGQAVVELNREIVDRSKYAETGLSSGDRVEILEFVGGG